MGKKIDMTGWKMWEHGVPDSKIIVIKENPIRSKDGHIQWDCKCAICNRQFIAIGKNIRNGNTKSDGCYQKTQASAANLINLTGQTFGRLTVLNITNHRKNHKVIYHCKCMCGNECDVLADLLKSGKTQSCGCLKTETIRKNFGYNLIGQTFEKLHVIKLSNRQEKDGQIWLCQCDCGKFHEVKTEFLMNGTVQSCGCIRYSIGEQNIEQILQGNHITYIRDKVYFDDLVNENNVKLRYDFIILKDNKPIRLIEFDGPQHNKSVDYFGGDVALKRLQLNDKLKNEYARTHNIPLVRIPYKERDQITLDLIMGDKYLVS